MPPQKRRENILTAAERIIAQKGIANVTTAKIAKAANISESLVYQYFKSKDELLFSIPAEHMQRFLNILHEHLQGITNVESQLSKAIWLHLKNQDTHVNYAKILLLECRSRIDFYKTKAYSLIQQYARLITDILTQGVKEGIYRDDIDPSLMRDMVLGTLDWESISFLIENETSESASGLNDILLLINDALRPPIESNRTKAEIILRAAQKIFATKGYFGATIADIASLANVSEGSIYEYYKNKEHLLLSIPVSHFTRHTELLSNSSEVQRPKIKLTRFIRDFFSIFLADRDFLKIFLLEIQFNRQFHCSEAYDNFKMYFKIIEGLLKDGQKTGEFHPEANARVFRNMLIGTFSHMALRWIILEKENEYDMMGEIEQIIDLLLSAISMPELMPPALSQ